MAPNRRQTIIWTNDGLVFRRIYESLDLDELKQNAAFIFEICMKRYSNLSHYLPKYFRSLAYGGQLPWVQTVNNYSYTYQFM